MISGAPTTERLPTGLSDMVVTIQPKHAHRIYQGEKQFELRRVSPRYIPSRIYLYESDGSRKISGHIVVSRLISGAPDAVWKRTNGLATTRERFIEYFAGRAVAFAFQIRTHLLYRCPLTLDDLLGAQPGFVAPQGFLYLRGYPKLEALLRERAFSEALGSLRSAISLRPFTANNAPLFTRLVHEHITDSYLETGRGYASKIVSLDTSPVDLEGVLTRRKRILEITKNNALVGFSVITEKLGGALKTGPTMLVKKHRGKQLGPQVRLRLHSLADSLGFRKIYCTVPTRNSPALKYLLASDYVVEAHLKRHYHPDHDEIVLGYSLADEDRLTGELPEHSDERARHFARLTNISASLTPLLAECFSEQYCDVSSDWALTQIRQAVASAKGRGSEFRPRAVYTAKGSRPLALALCVFKRGGSTKILLMRRTSHIPSLIRFIAHVERSLASTTLGSTRKLYTHVWLHDTSGIQVFSDLGYTVEGVLRCPYSVGRDFVAMGKLM